MEQPAKIIYDFGMNNGDDVAYYLTRADRVIAVEANTALCREAEQRFSAEIAAGRLTILNVALSAQASDVPLPFYIHRTNHVISQLPKPAADQLHLFDEVLIEQETAEAIIRRFGEAHYIKIDIEGCDQIILKGLLEAGIAPEFISAECHRAEVFCLLGAMGYRSFNIVDGPSVEDYGFPAHSAGPFGPDIPTSWYDLDAFFYRLGWEQLGWKDIHAAKSINGKLTGIPAKTMGPSEHIRDFLPSFGRAFRRRLAHIRKSR